MPIFAERVTVFAGRSESRPLIKDLNYSFADRSLTLVIGRTGAGKSTLLRVLAGLRRCDEGTVTVDGMPLWIGGRLNRPALLRLSIAFQFPETQLFAATLEREFHYTLRPYRIAGSDRERRIGKALEDMRLPRETLQISPLTLSGGEKRRAALATLTAAETPWLLLDEPSAGMDAKAAAQLKELLAEWKKTRGIVMATHDWEMFMPVADSVAVISEGEMIAAMKAEEFSEHPETAELAGLGAPQSVKLVRGLKRAGFDAAERLWTPERLAELIAARCGVQGEAGVRADFCNGPAFSGETEAPDSPSCGGRPEKGDARIATVPAARQYQQHAAGGVRTRTAPGENVRQQLPGGTRPIYRMEARFKWLLFFLLSILVLLTGGSWTGALAGLAMAAGALALLTREHAARALRFSVPPLLFLLFAASVSGVRIAPGASGTEFSFAAAAESMRGMLPFLSVTMMSFAFTLSTSLSAMKRALERALSALNKFGLPTAMPALAATLTLRFIPMIMAEAARFSEIAAARGKRKARTGLVRPSELRVFVIPLLMSLFQKVEDVITALEIKEKMR